MPDKSFFDTNILIYFLAHGDHRAVIAERALATGGVVSIQVLNEFASVIRRKLQMNWNEVERALEAIRDLCETVPLTNETHEHSVRIARKYKFEIYHACVIASALESACSVLYSEALQDGQVIEGRLTIRNPFARSLRNS
jgi:predicted nucleic acid-binding protein